MFVKPVITCLILIGYFNILGSVNSTSSHQFSSTPLLFQRIQALSKVNQKVGTNIGTKNNIDTHHNRAGSLHVDDTKMLNPKGFYRTSSSGIGYGDSWRSSQTEEGSSSSGYSDPTSSSSQVQFHLKPDWQLVG